MNGYSAMEMIVLLALQGISAQAVMEHPDAVTVASQMTRV